MNTISLKASCLQPSLARGLSVVSRAVTAGRSLLPGLSHVLIAADHGQLKLSATDLEIGITCWLPANIETEGAVTVPVRTLADLVNAMPPERVDLSVDAGTHTLNVKCGRYNNNLCGAPADDFPLLPSPDTSHAIRIEPATLAQAIGQVAFAVSTDENRPILTGVLMHVEAGRLTLTAADGFRLAVRSEPLAGQEAADPLAVIVPGRLAGELSRLVKLGGAQFSPQENPVEVVVSPNRVVFCLDAIELSGQLIDGKYPDCQPIIPKRHAARAVVNTAELINAYKLAEVFAREQSHIVKLAVTPGDGMTGGRVTLSAVSAEVGDNTGPLDAEVEGGAVEVILNARYMLDVLAVVGAPQVALELTDAASPATVRPAGGDDRGRVGKDGEYVCVMMPMQHDQEVGDHA